MGVFSWYTTDTNEPIWNAYSGQPKQTIFMLDNKGNVWIESNYEGYGEFGGKDYFELLAEMNGLGSDRMKGIHFNQKYGTQKIFPNLVINPECKWKDGTKPRDHEGQGFWNEDE